MTYLKSKLSVLVLLVYSMIFANCSNSTTRSNANPIIVAGTTWIKMIVNDHYSYIVFNLDSTFVEYARGSDVFFYGKYSVKDGKIILHVLKGEFDYEFPEGSIHRAEKKDYVYIISDNKMYILDDKGNLEEDKPFLPAPQNWTAPPREN